MNRNLLAWSILILFLLPLTVGTTVFATPIPINVGDRIELDDAPGPNATIPAGMGGHIQHLHQIVYGMIL